MTSVSCRQCGSKFALTPRAGRDTHRSRSGRARSFTDAQFCSRKCKQANYRWRRSQGRSAVTRKAKKIGKGPRVLSAVTPLVQHIDITNEISTKIEGARPRQIAGPPLSDRSLHLASLALDPETAANVRRANREVYLPTAKVSWPSSGDALVGCIRETKVSGDPGPIPAVLRRIPKVMVS